MNQTPFRGYRHFREYWARVDETQLGLRVNDSEASTHPGHGHRSEVTANGLALIDVPEDLRDVVGAELVLELWGGHAWTDEKRVTLNGHRTYELPPDGTDIGFCAFTFPRIRIRVSDLIRGTNVLQFSCERGQAGWGHYIVYNVGLRLFLADGHETHAPSIRLEADGTAMQARIELPDDAASEIERVDYYGAYAGYAAGGGFEVVSVEPRVWTKRRDPYLNLARGTGPEHEASLVLDTGLPQPQPTRLFAVATSASGTRSCTNVESVVGVPSLPASVMCGATTNELPFWSRDNTERRGVIEIPRDVAARATGARFHLRVWNGGPGTVDRPIRLNGQPLEIDLSADTGDLSYEVCSIPADLLRAGANEVTVLSDTEHHGIEVLMPGPALEVFVE